MSKTFTLRMTIGFFEAEMLINALENYTPKKPAEAISKKDLIRLINYQMDQKKQENRLKKEILKEVTANADKED